MSWQQMVVCRSVGAGAGARPCLIRCAAREGRVVADEETWYISAWGMEKRANRCFFFGIKLRQCAGQWDTHQAESKWEVIAERSWRRRSRLRIWRDRSSCGKEEKGLEVESQLAYKLELSAADMSFVGHCSRDALAWRKGNSQALHGEWGFVGLPSWVTFVAYNWAGGGPVKGLCKVMQNSK